MVLTVQTTEVTPCAGQRQTGGARVEMIEGFLLDGVDGQRTGFVIDLADEHAIVITTTATAACPIVGDTTMMRTEQALHHAIVKPLIILTLFQFSIFNFQLKDDRFVDVEFSIAPTIPAQAGLVLRTVGYELFFGPVHLVSHLWQVGATAIALADIDAVLVQLELVEALDATHGGEDGDLDIEVVEFVASHRHETRILESSSTRHLSHDLMQGRILAKMSDTTTQTALLVEGDEGTTVRREVRG